jgi:PUA domain protein
MPLLTQPATLPEANEEPTEEIAEAEAEVEEEVPKKGKKGKGGGGKKAKGAKGKKEEAEPVEEEAGEITLIDEIWPKKEALGLTKWYVPLSFTKIVVWAGTDSSHDRISIYTVNTVPLFVQHFDGPFVPTLKLLHRCKLISFGWFRRS